MWFGCFVLFYFHRGWAHARSNYGLKLRRQKCRLPRGRHFLTAKAVREVKIYLAIEGKNGHKTKMESIQTHEQHVFKSYESCFMLFNLKMYDIFSPLFGNT